MFSRMSLSTYCRVLTKTHVGRQSFPQTRSLHVSHRSKDIGLRIRCLGSHSSHSTVFNTNFIRFASTTEIAKATEVAKVTETAKVTEAAKATEAADVTKVPAEDVLPQIPEPPTLLEPEIAEIVGEATLQSYGLGGYFPIGLTQHLLYWVHTTCGLPWWATIIMGTVGVKALLFPIFLKMQKHQALTQVYAEDLGYFERRKREALADANQMKVQLYSQKQDLFFATHGMLTSKKTMINYAIQGSVFFTFFMAMNGMARAPIESMREGGLFWFSDLTVADPYYILPIMSAVTTALIVHFSPPPAMGIKLQGIQRYFKFMVPVVTLPFMIFFKSAVLLYIITSAWLTFLSHLLIKIPKFRAFCKLPPMGKVSSNTLTQPGESNTASIRDTLKELWYDIKHSRATNAAYLLDQKNFEAAGRGALTKTYKFDPTKDISRAVRTNR